MYPRHLRVASLYFSLVLCLALGIVWVNQAVARPPAVADFAPTYTHNAAQQRIAAAREAEQQRRLAALADTNQLPLLPTVFFAQTGHHLSNRTGFLDFWRANGQVKVFGYPISEEIVEGDRVVQYFERARFEYHPELAGTPFQVQLGLLGREVTGWYEMSGYLAGFPADPMNGSRFFPETGHTLLGDFRYFWEKHGGVDIFGLPITEQYQEDGRLIQYFERARFEYFPEDMDPFYRNGLNLHTLNEVQIRDIGRWVADARGVDVAPVAQLAGAPQWTPALWERAIHINLSTQWLTAYEGDIPVYTAPVATGRDGFNTPVGTFAVYDKLRMQTMQGSAGGESWHVPNIPWVMYIYGGVALHGTYWHNAFGTGARPSHGCINLSMDDAQWLYEWADIGTTVQVHY
jgi:hypothetical protein